jgi:tetratricopeptide (TPR) repeat protein
VAEGILGGLLGGEGEAEAEAGREARAAAEAYAAAVVAEEARNDPSVAEDTKAFLKEQSRFLRVQTDDLQEQRPVRLSLLRRQRFGQGIRIGMQLFTATLLGLITLGLVMMIVDAARSHVVVVEPFNAPPSLAAAGFNGEIVAAGVMDDLQKLANATRSARSVLDVKSAWSSDVKVEVPETGVSIGEISRLLHRRIGHDLHIGGDLIQTPMGGLAMTVRGDGIPPETFTGAAGDLDKLTTEAAEYIYGRSEPRQFAAYLFDNNRNTEALEFLPGAYARAATDNARSILANQWGNAFANLNRPAEAAEKYRLAMELDPKNGTPRSNLLLAITATQGEEAGWRASQEFLKRAREKGEDTGPEMHNLASPAELTWDLPLLLASLQADASHDADADTPVTVDGPSLTDAYALMHDPVNAFKALAASDPDDPMTKAEAAMLAAYDALDRNDPAAAVAPLETFWDAWLKDPSINSTFLDNGCLLGLAYGLTRRFAEAEAVFTRVGKWSRCYALHGDVLEFHGDLPGAERVWAEGLSVGPDLPFVYLHRGLSAEKRGDTTSALADFAAANAQAPHFADPLKAWGDLLASQGNTTEALAKYDEALKYAPAWTQLQQARAAAAGRTKP